MGETGGLHTAKRRRVLVVHGGTREASGRSTHEPRERLVRQCRQLGGLEGVSLARGLWVEGGEVETKGRGQPSAFGGAVERAGVWERMRLRLLGDCWEVLGAR